MRHFLAVCLLAQFGHAGWRKTEGIIGGSIASLAMGESAIFGRADGAAYRSLDSGATWSAIGGDVPAKILSVAAQDSTVYLGTDAGLYRSRDNGRTWLRLQGGLQVDTVASLAVFGPMVFAGDGRFDNFRSLDGGETWTRLADARFPVLAFGEALLIALENGGIFRSRDSGKSWTGHDVGGQGNRVSAVAAIGSILYAGSPGSGFSRSRDSGSTWELMNHGLENYSVSYIGARGSTLFAANGQGFLRSTDGGETWTRSDSGLSAPVVGLAGIGATLLAVTGGGGGMFRSRDTGRTWHFLEHPLTWGGIDKVFLNGSSLFAGSASAVFRSRDDGGTWKWVMGAPDVKAFAKLGSAVFVGAADGVFRSRDDGNSWTRAAIAAEGASFPVLSLATHGTALFAGTDRGGGLFRSLDSGATWSRVGSGLPASIAHIAGGGTAIYVAGTPAAGTYRSLDNGETWSPSPAPIGVRALAADDSTAFLGTNSGNISRTRDGGATWEVVARNPISSIISLAIHGRTIYAGTLGDNLYISRDHGETWTRQPATQPGSFPMIIASLAVNDSMIFAGQSGVWKLPLSEAEVSVRQRPPARARFATGGILRPGQPIHFTLAAPGTAQLEVFDPRGHRVATLLRAYLPAGSRQVAWDLDAPEGLYVLRLRAGGESAARRVLYRK